MHYQLPAVDLSQDGLWWRALSLRSLKRRRAFPSSVTQPHGFAKSDLTKAHGRVRVHGARALVRTGSGVRYEAAVVRSKVAVKVA